MSRYPIALLSLFTLNPVSAALAQSQPYVQLPEVVVTGTSPARQTRQELEQEQSLTPGGVTLVDGEALYERNVNNVADTLRYAPGVWAAGSGTDGAFISIRGSNLDAAPHDGNGVKLMQDGLPVTAADGNNHNRIPDPLSASHVIVARGANALTYGASTLGGAIDFISRTAHDTAPLEIYLNAGSHGLWQGRLTAGKVADKFDGLVTIDAKRRDGYRGHNRQERESLDANLGWQFSDAVRSRFYFTHVENDEELPGALTREQFRADPYQANPGSIAGNFQWNVKTWRLANKTTWDVDANSSLSIGVSYEEQDLYHPIVENPFFSLLIDTEQRSLGTAVRYNVRLGQHNLLAGLNYGQTWVKGGNYGSSGGIPATLRERVDNSADNLELFVMDRWRFAPGWTAVYGAQAVTGSREVRNIDPATGSYTRNPKDDYNSINPRVGLVHHLSPDAELFTNLGRVYEAPTLYQMNDQVAGGEATLKAMRGTAIEVGTRGKNTGGNNRWHWDLAAYYTKLRNEILSVDDPAAPGTGRNLSLNVDDTIHAGIEALVGASFPVGAEKNHRIEPLINLAINHFRFDNDAAYGDNRLPVVPRYSVKGEVLYRNANGFFVGPTFDVVSKRYADFSNTYEVDSYTLWGLRAGYASKNWEVSGEIRNLADKVNVARTGVQALSPANAALLQAGEPRSVYVGMRTRF